MGGGGRWDMVVDLCRRDAAALTRLKHPAIVKVKSTVTHKFEATKQSEHHLQLQSSTKISQEAFGYPNLHM